MGLDPELDQCPSLAASYQPLAPGSLPTTLSLPHPSYFRGCRFDHKTFLLVCLVLKHAHNKSKPFSGMLYFSFLEGKIGVQILKNKGFSGGSVVKNLPSMQETQETWV